MASCKGGVMASFRSFVALGTLIATFFFMPVWASAQSSAPASDLPEGWEEPVVVPEGKYRLEDLPADGMVPRTPQAAPTTPMPAPMPTPPVAPAAPEQIPPPYIEPALPPPAPVAAPPPAPVAPPSVPSAADVGTPSFGGDTRTQPVDWSNAPAEARNRGATSPMPRTTASSPSAMSPAPVAPMPSAPPPPPMERPVYSGAASDLPEDWHEPTPVPEGKYRLEDLPGSGGISAPLTAPPPAPMMDAGPNLGSTTGNTRSLPVDWSKAPAEAQSGTPAPLPMAPPPAPMPEPYAEPMPAPVAAPPPPMPDVPAMTGAGAVDGNTRSLPVDWSKAPPEARGETGAAPNAPMSAPPPPPMERPGYSGAQSDLPEDWHEPTPVPEGKYRLEDLPGSTAVPRAAPIAPMPPPVAPAPMPMPLPPPAAAAPMAAPPVMSVPPPSPQPVPSIEELPAPMQEEIKDIDGEDKPKGGPESQTGRWL